MNYIIMHLDEHGEIQDEFDSESDDDELLDSFVSPE